MNPKMKAKLASLAARRCLFDREDFETDDFAAGNVNDAYDRGVEDGETALARELLAEFGGSDELAEAFEGNGNAN